MGATAADTFRILIATDNHLGYAEKDPERGNDSFETFEEILGIAQEKKVDLILLGGDLFHENKPSRQCVIRCMDLLRRYTFGDKAVEFNFVSDPAVNFKHSKNPMVNYMDPNLNVAIPVFSIHGNHDDPAGMGQMCALEMLSTAGLINYFGRTNDLKDIVISPLLLEKGRAKLALYGLSAIKDERLFRLFRENKVKMLRPKEDMDSWFNLLCIHQNRTKHGQTNYIPENFLDPFLHLVLWGHEHQCLLDPQQTVEDSFYVTQPGSSVVTSLCASEADVKHVGLLEINHNQQFKITPIPLKTVRPFIFEDLCLSDLGLDDVYSGKMNEVVESVVEEELNKMIKKAKNLLTGHPKQPKKPLLRLRVEYTSEAEMFNTTRFGHRFEGQVANPNEIVLFRKARPETKMKDSVQGVDKEAMDTLFAEDVSETRVEDLVEQYFASLEHQNQQLYLVSERGMANAVRAFVDKDDKDAISTIIQQQIEKTKKHLLKLEHDIDEEDKVEEEVVAYRLERLAKKGTAIEEDKEAQAVLENPERAKKRGGAKKDDFSDLIDDDSNDDDDDLLEPVPQKPARGRGSRGGRGRARGAASSKMQLSMQSDGSPKSPGRGRGRGRGRAASKNQSIMESFQRAAAVRRGVSKKNVVYISDSDSD